jgi:hypothetical protein
MGLIEVEIRGDRALELVVLLIGAGPQIPMSTLPALGPDRLIRAWSWDSVRLGGDGTANPPLQAGVILASARVTIHHVSIAELDADPQAMGSSATATVLLQMSAKPGALMIDMVQLSVDGAVPYLLSPSVRVGVQQLPPLGAAATQIDAGAVVWDSGVVTIRFGTRGVDNLYLPPANRVLASGDEWAIRISGEAFAEVVREQLQNAEAGLPDGVSVEDPASASWTGSEVVGSIGLKRTDACKGLLGLFPVDMSVSVNATLALNPVLTAAASSDKLRLTLQLSTAASDWDSFRCWLGSGAFAGLIPVVGIAVGIGSLAYVGHVAKVSASDALAGLDPGGGFARKGGGNDAPIYEASIALPTLLPIPEKVNSATVGGDGLVVSGDSLVIPIAEHRTDFEPTGDTIAGQWHGHLDCKTLRWADTYEPQSVSVTDPVFVLGQLLGNVPVTVFPTTHAIPPGRWSVAFVTSPFWIETITVTPDDSNGPGPGGVLYLHCSAGLRRYVIGPVPPAPQPSAEQLGIAELNCQRFGREWNEKIKLSWLVDPPIDASLPPLRQWQIVVAHVDAGTTWTITAEHAGGDDLGELATITAARSGSMAVEVITDAMTEITLRPTPGVSQGARLAQRWLVPTKMIELPAPARSLSRDGAILTVETQQARVLVRTTDGAIAQRRQSAEVPPSARDADHLPPPSLTLPDGTVVAVWADKLIFARSSGFTRQPNHWPLDSTDAVRPGA